MVFFGNYRIPCSHLTSFKEAHGYCMPIEVGGSGLGRRGGEKRKDEKLIDAKSPLTIKLEKDIEEIEVEFWLDDALAYHNKLLVSDVPL